MTIGLDNRFPRDATSFILFMSLKMPILSAFKSAHRQSLLVFRNLTDHSIFLIEEAAHDA
jgi:hypothetical protein